MARPRGIRKAQADAVLLLAYLGSLYTAQLHPNPLFPLQLQHNSHPSKTLLSTGFVSNPAFLKRFSRCNAFLNTLTIWPGAIFGCAVQSICTWSLSQPICSNSMSYHLSISFAIIIMIFTIALSYSPRLYFTRNTMW